MKKEIIYIYALTPNECVEYLSGEVINYGTIYQIDENNKEILKQVVGVKQRLSDLIPLDDLPDELKPNLENLEIEFKQKVQELLDAKAREKGYDNINSAVSYAGFENPFQDEAIRLGKWRSKVWQFGYSLLEQIRSGEINAGSLTMDEILDKLPKLNEKD